MEEASTSTDDQVLKTIFENYMAWRAGILKVLKSDKGWEVRLPWEELPAVLQEPSLGINFARGSILSKDWLSLEATRSDAWLVRFEQFYIAKLGGKSRKILADMIKEVPKLHDVVTQQPVRENAIFPNTRGNKSPSTRLKRRFKKAQDKTSTHQAASSRSPGKEALEQAEDVHGDLDVHTDCSICRGKYTFKHWIGCDTCERWFHSKCVQITPAEAELKPSYKCHFCSQ